MKTEAVIIIYIQPSDFALEKTTIWSFKERGDWATHSGEYRGNWSPYVPRNLILRYTKPGEWVLDQFVGSGTTLVEAKLLNRHAIGLGINNKAINLARKNCKFHLILYRKFLLNKVKLRIYRL